MAEKKVMRSFRLRRDAGTHYEPNPDFDRESLDTEDNPKHFEFKAGQVVKSTRPLDKLFVNKFIPLSGGSGAQSAGGDDSGPEDDPDNDRPVTSVEDALHHRPERHLEDDQLKPKHKKSLGKKTKHEGSAKLGDECTEEFEGASDADFVVYKDKRGKFAIADADEPAKALKKGLKRSRVSDAIKKLSKS